MNIKGRFDHFNVNVTDLDRSIRFYETALGLKEVGRKEAADGSFILVYMGDGVTGGGLHGKDLSKADVSVNIFAHLEAQRLGHPVELHCAIGDTEVGGIPYSVIVDTAREYINNLGGFEKFAEWGLLRP